MCPEKPDVDCAVTAVVAPVQEEKPKAKRVRKAKVDYSPDAQNRRKVSRGGAREAEEDQPKKQKNRNLNNNNPKKRKRAESSEEGWRKTSQTLYYL